MVSALPRTTPDPQRPLRRPASPRPAERRGTRPRRRLLLSRQTAGVLALVGALGLGAAVLGGPELARAAFLTPFPLPWWVLAVAFAATEACVLHIQVRREAQTVSLSELPLVLGLFFAAPAQLALGRLVGSAAVFVVHRRSPPLKTAFNLALVAAETAVALTVFTALSGLAGPVSASSPVSWLSAMAAAVSANAIGAVAIGLVIALYEGDLSLRGLLAGAVTGQTAAPAVITMALVAVTSLAAAPVSAWLLGGACIGLLLAYRAYAALSDRHLNLERLFRFSQAVRSSPEIDEVLGSVLAEAKELLRSERAEIVFVSPTSAGPAHVRLGASGRLSREEALADPTDAWLLDAVIGNDAPVLLPRGSRDVDVRAWLAAHASREAVAVPLRGSAGVIGAVLVLDRLGDVRTYDSDDVLLLETVANHAGTALENGELIDRLRHEAAHDALTGLPNRAFLQRRLAAALDDLRDGRSTGTAVMILDLNGFKEVNDTLGHQHGDRLLVELAARLVTATGTSALVTRLGGDEFAVLVAHAVDEDQVVQLGHRVLRALEEPVELDGLEVEVSGSLGIALAPAHAEDAAGLLKCADMAMYDAKGATRGLRVYSPDLDTNSPRRLALAGELRTALASGDIDVHVQPQAHLATGAVTSVEALVRWTHPDLGPIAPDEFVPVAERSGLIGPLTSYVLDRSLAAVADWRAQGIELDVAVNLSTRSLHDTDLVEEVARLLRRHDVLPGKLTLEVTEGSVMADPTRAIALLHQLRAIGVRLSVDDFGTGHSSLSYLQRLPVHEVKIDRSFITELTGSGQGAAITRAIVDLGHHLELQVVAEGVEDQATWDLLATMGCDLVQGWHLSRALPPDAIPGWMADRIRSDG